MARRIVPVLSLVLVASIGCSSSSSPQAQSSSSPQPTLGQPWGSAPESQHGYGEVTPTFIDNGGDPTGRVEDLTWDSWGGDQAIGHGMSYYPHTSVADSTREPVTVVAFQLGTCDGSPAYQAVEWFFQGHGGMFDPSSYINDCTGDYVNPR